MAAKPRSPSAKNDPPSVNSTTIAVEVTRDWPALIQLAVIAMTITVAPELANARAGSGSSMGSRGSMTYSAPPTTNTAPDSPLPTQPSVTPPQQVIVPPNPAKPQLPTHVAAPPKTVKPPSDANITQALNIITNFASKICQTPSLEQSDQSFGLSGDAKAKVGGLIGKIADLGISGASEYKSERSSGVLQKDLASAIQNGNDCKFKVFTILHGDLIGGSKLSPQSLNPGR